MLNVASSPPNAPSNIPTRSLLEPQDRKTHIGRRCFFFSFFFSFRFHVKECALHTLRASTRTPEYSHRIIHDVIGPNDWLSLRCYQSRPDTRVRDFPSVRRIVPQRHIWRLHPYAARSLVRGNGGPSVLGVGSPQVLVLGLKGFTSRFGYLRIIHVEAQMRGFNGERLLLETEGQDPIRNGNHQDPSLSRGLVR